MPRFLILALALTSLASCSKKNDKPQPDADTKPTLASFTWSGQQRVNTDISFVNKSENADTYNWDFGNGQTSTKQTPDNVKYNGEGAFNVILVASKGSNRAVYQQTLVIAADDKPVPHFTYIFKDQKNYAPATVIFENRSVNAQTFKWQINGQTFYDRDLIYTFNQAKTYEVKLTAVNGINEATYSDIINVNPNSNPEAKFALPYHPYPYAENEEIIFVNQSKNADAWEWTFGNGGPAPSSDEHPVVKFNKAGIYTITLVAKKGNLRSTAKSINLKIGS